jgi:hypothetical protein
MTSGFGFACGSIVRIRQASYSISVLPVLVSCLSARPATLPCVRLDVPDLARRGGNFDRFLQRFSKSLSCPLVPQPYRSIILRFSVIRFALPTFVSQPCKPLHSLAVKCWCSGQAVSVCDTTIHELEADPLHSSRRSARMETGSEPTSASLSRLSFQLRSNSEERDQLEDSHLGCWTLPPG